MENRTGLYIQNVGFIRTWCLILWYHRIILSIYNCNLVINKNYCGHAVGFKTVIFSARTYSEQY